MILKNPVYQLVLLPTTIVISITLCWTIQLSFSQSVDNLAATTEDVPLTEQTFSSLPKEEIVGETAEVLTEVTIRKKSLESDETPVTSYNANNESPEASDSLSSVSVLESDPESINGSETSSESKSSDGISTKEGEKRKSNSNPSMDEIISGIIQLIGGNVKLGRPLGNQKPQLSNNGRPIFMQYPIHPSRINNRGPPKVSFVGPAPQEFPNLIPPSVLIGPGMPAGLPLLFPSSQPTKTIPVHLLPTKPFVSMAESEMSILMEHVKPKTKDIVVNHTRKEVAPMRTHINDLTSGESSKGSVESHKLSASFSSPVITDAPTSSSTTATTQATPTLALSSTSSSTEALASHPSETRNHTLPPSSSTSKVAATTSTTTTNAAAAATTTGVADINANMTMPALSSNTTEVVASNVVEPTGIVLTFISTATEFVPNGPVTDWMPFYLESSSSSTKHTWEGEPPSIITMGEEPSVFDITVKHKMGTGNTKINPSISVERPSVVVTTDFKSEPSIAFTLSLPSEPSFSFPSVSSLNLSTILSSSSFSYSESSSSTSLSSSSSKPSMIAPTKVLTETKTNEPDIIYGRPVVPKDTSTRNSNNSSSSNSNSKRKPTLPPSTTTTTTTTTTTKATTPLLGRPIVIPVEVDEVKPLIAGHSPSGVLTEAGQGSVYIDGKSKHFKLKPNANHGPTLQVGSAVTINVEDNKNKGNSKQYVGPGGNSRPAVVRRPPFRPRPNTPLVRIDTCIVGDDSTCGANLNERCKTELGISSCQCKPGFGRTTARGMCSPVTTLSVSLRVDKIDNNKITFTRKYLDPDSEEYQYLEYEAIQAISSVFSISRFSKVFMGAKINKFYSMSGKTVINATVELEMNNATKSSSMKRIIQQEIGRVIALHNNNIGDSKLIVEGSLNAVPRVEDINECSHSELNDCAKNALCYNEFGSFRCACRPGYEDKFAKDVAKAGRVCSACSPQHCSNRGDCYVVNGERECKCRGNFIGSRCDIDGEVLGVALGGSIAALIIIIITFLCLYMWNQRWKREQQKMEAMSSGSGQTFSYVNKQQVSNGAYRYTMDDRIRWAQMSDAVATNPTYNYYVNPEHLMATSQQHVYATPSRVQTPDALLNEDSCPVEPRHYTRPPRNKSRSSGHLPYQSMGYGPGSIYNETEFSTRETCYTPAHLIANPRTKYGLYN